MDHSKSGENRLQQFALVGRNDEEPGVKAELLYASAKRRLCIARQFICIVEHHCFEHGPRYRVCFGKQSQILADELNTFPVGTVHINDILADVVGVAGIQFPYELVHQCFLAASQWTVEYNIRNSILGMEIVELRYDMTVNGQGHTRDCVRLF